MIEGGKGEVWYLWKRKIPICTETLLMQEDWVPLSQRKTNVFLLSRRRKNKKKAKKKKKKQEKKGKLWSG